MSGEPEELADGSEAAIALLKAILSEDAEATEFEMQRVIGDPWNTRSLAGIAAAALDGFAELARRSPIAMLDDIAAAGAQE